MPPVTTSSCLKLSSTFQREDSLASGQIPETCFCSFTAACSFSCPWDPQRIVFPCCFFFLNHWQEKIFHLHRQSLVGLPSLKVSAPARLSERWITRVVRWLWKGCGLTVVFRSPLSAASLLLLLLLVSVGAEIHATVLPTLHMWITFLTVRKDQCLEGFWCMRKRL